MKKYTIEDLTTITAPELSNIKVIINNKKASESLQLALFRVGGSWSNGATNILYKDKPVSYCKYIYISSDTNGNLIMTRDNNYRVNCRTDFNSKSMNRIVIKKN